MGYYIPSKIVREILLISIDSVAKGNTILDTLAIQKLMADLLNHEVYIIRDQPQSKSKLEMFNDRR